MDPPRSGRASTPGAPPAPAPCGLSISSLPPPSVSDFGASAAGHSARGSVLGASPAATPAPCGVSAASSASPGAPSPGASLVGHPCGASVLSPSSRAALDASSAHHPSSVAGPDLSLPGVGAPLGASTASRAGLGASYQASSVPATWDSCSARPSMAALDASTAYPPSRHALDATCGSLLEASLAYPPSRAPLDASGTYPSSSRARLDHSAHYPSSAGALAGSTSTRQPGPASLGASASIHGAPSRPVPTPTGFSRPLTPEDPRRTPSMTAAPPPVMWPPDDPLTTPGAAAAAGLDSADRLRQQMAELLERYHALVEHHRASHRPAVAGAMATPSPLHAHDGAPPVWSYFRGQQHGPFAQPPPPSLRPQAVTPPAQWQPQPGPAEPPPPGEVPSGPPDALLRLRRAFSKRQVARLSPPRATAMTPAPEHPPDPQRGSPSPPGVGPAGGGLIPSLAAAAAAAASSPPARSASRSPPAPASPPQPRASGGPSGRQSAGAKGVCACKPTTPRSIQFRRRLVDFYEFYAPDKLWTVGATLRQYQGMEETLFDCLIRMYGPEPAQRPPSVPRTHLSPPRPRPSSPAGQSVLGSPREAVQYPPRLRVISGERPQADGEWTVIPGAVCAGLPVWGLGPQRLYAHPTQGTWVVAPSPADQSAGVAYLESAEPHRSRPPDVLPGWLVYDAGGWVIAPRTLCHAAAGSPPDEDSRVQELRIAADTLGAMAHAAADDIERFFDSWRQGGGPAGEAAGPPNAVCPQQ
eukprot:TRINITY_DN70694_c0_g1_i1.p1 TRINITY_DN70694_c0_g1~~TRINITY_DN70694_c0_g1_i1.p1  ORF type:complete len:781 (+),score=144.54 TRINITY_DN70694_c0_g1_i1:81-2345(+)